MKVDINAAQVDAQAGRVEQLASEIKGKSVERLNGVVMNTRMAWEGDAAAFFDQYMTDGVTKLEQFSKNLNEYANTLRAIAKEVRYLQQQAREQGKL